MGAEAGRRDTFALVLDGAVGGIERWLMRWQLAAGEMETL